VKRLFPLHLFCTQPILTGSTFTCVGFDRVKRRGLVNNTESDCALSRCKVFIMRERSRIVKRVIDRFSYLQHYAVVERRKNPHAIALGRKGGKSGGPARATKLTPEERRTSAKKAAQARWKLKLDKKHTVTQRGSWLRNPRSQVRFLPGAPMLLTALFILSVLSDCRFLSRFHCNAQGTC
jgi:hypothetical protein